MVNTRQVKFPDANATLRAAPREFLFQNHTMQTTPTIDTDPSFTRLAKVAMKAGLFLYEMPKTRYAWMRYQLGKKTTRTNKKPLYDKNGLVAGMQDSDGISEITIVKGFGETPANAFIEAGLGKLLTQSDRDGGADE